MNKAKRILAVASGGGHWIQLLRLRPAFQGCDVAYITTLPGYRHDVEPARFHLVNDASRWDKLAVLRQAIRVAMIVLKERPDVVITTGAAPGYFAVRVANLLRKKTIWLDSIANVDEVSLSGRAAGPRADVFLTQWPHLAKESGPRYEGAVL